MSSINSICAKSSSTTFEFTVNGVSELSSAKLYTPVFTLQNTELRVFVQKCGKDEETTLGIFLLHSQKYAKFRLFTARATFRLLSFDEHKQKCELEYGSHDFSEPLDWGFSKFITWNELFNPSNGYVKDDKIILQCEVTAFAPQHVIWNTSKDLIQVVSHSSNYFVNPLLQIMGFCEYEKEVDLLNSKEINMLDSINRQLEEIKQIFGAFEWSLTDALKHDVVKFLKLFFETIKMAGGPLALLFEGQQRSCMKLPNGNELAFSSKVFQHISMTHDNGNT